jgi:tetratricopeptide (TPR) repeat protein
MQLSPIIATIHEYKGKLDHIKLEHLTDSETHALVTHLVPQNSTGTEQLKQKIVERSEGNPLYAEEIVRMLLEEQRKNQSYDNQSTASTLSFLENIPSTLAGLILARFDSFPLDTRKTLQHAAIIGRTFPVSLLQLLENDSTKNIQQQLAQATESQFIQFLPNNGEDYYAFRHAIFQAVIYQTMLRRDREFIHEKIAQIIEYSGYQLGASFGNFNEILAYHYGKSVQPELAIPYYIASAENAARHSAHESAIKYFRKALALMDTDSLELNTELARVNINLGESLKFTGELQKAKEVLNKILQKMPFWGIRLESSLIFLPIFIHGLRELADVCIQSGEYEEATTHLKAGIEALGDDGEREYASLWRSLVERLAFVYLSQGNPADSFNLAKSATAGMDHEFADEPVLLAQLFNIMGGSSWLQGDLLHGIHYVEKSLQLYEAAGYTRGISQAHTNLGTLYFRQGKWPNAVENLEKGLKTSNEIGDIPSQVIILSNLGNLRLAMGEHNLARQALMKSLSLRQQLGYVYALEQTNNALSRLALVEGDFKNALEFALIGQQMGIKTGSKLIELHALRLLALLDLHEERYEEATQKIMGIVAQANAGNLYVIEADCFRVLAHIHLQNGANEEAETVLLQAIKYYQDQNDSYYLGHSFFGLGCVYTVTHVDNPEQGKTYLRKAEAIFRVLGAKHDRKITQQILTREDALRCVNYAY